MILSLLPLTAVEFKFERVGARAARWRRRASSPKTRDITIPNLEKLPKKTRSSPRALEKLHAVSEICKFAEMDENAKMADSQISPEDEAEKYKTEANEYFKSESTNAKKFLPRSAPVAVPFSGKRAFPRVGAQLGPRLGDGFLRRLRLVGRLAHLNGALLGANFAHLGFLKIFLRPPARAILKILGGVCFWGVNVEFFRGGSRNFECLVCEKLGWLFL